MLFRSTCAAVAADWLGPPLPAAAVAGRGGAVGAYVRFQLEDTLDSPGEWIAFATVFAMGLLLAADRLVMLVLRIKARVLRRAGRLAVRGNDRVAAVSERVFDTAARFSGDDGIDFALVPRQSS